MTPTAACAACCPRPSRPGGASPQLPFVRWPRHGRISAKQRADQRSARCFPAAAAGPCPAALRIACQNEFPARDRTPHDLTRRIRRLCRRETPPPRPPCPSSGPLRAARRPAQGVTQRAFADTQRPAKRLPIHAVFRRPPSPSARDRSTRSPPNSVRRQAPSGRKRHVPPCPGLVAPSDRRRNSNARP